MPRARDFCLDDEVADIRAYERLQGELAEARADAAAVRELMNVYNLGGWTDALGPMRRALKAEAERDALRKSLRYMRGLAGEAFSHLDADKDVKCLKLLHAMAGHGKGYRADVDEALAVLDESPNESHPT